MLKDQRIFLREFITHFESTGTICPSSKWAAEAITESLRTKRQGQHILEVGAGTGAFTVQILESMLDSDTLTICELNPRFIVALKKKLEKNSFYQLHKDRIRFFEGPVQELEEDRKYDLIVSALPFTNFTAELCKDIFEKLRRIGHKNTKLSFIEYIGLRKIKKAVSNPKDKERLSQVDEFFEQMYDKHHTTKKRVWLNILPLTVYQMNIAA